MKRGAAWALALVIFFAAASGGFSELTEGQTAEADAFFSRFFEKANVVSGGVLIARGGERIYAAFYGPEDRKTKRPVDENTVFKAASVTKLITAMGIMRLVDEGTLSLDAGLTGPGGLPIRNPRFPDAPITLRQVMSHTSSLLSSAPYAAAPQWEQLDQKDTRYFSAYAPGTRYEYANLNGGILGSVIERATGQSLNSFMSQALFSPLGINAAYSAHLLPDPDRLATSYFADDTVYMTGEKYRASDAERYDDSCGPDRHYHASVGGLYISLAGLEKLGMVLAGDGVVGETRVLSGRSVRLMRADQAQLPDSQVTAQSPYGLCVHRFTAPDGVTWYGHQGRWEGLLTDLFVEPESETVLALVLNGVKASNNGQGIHPRAESVMTFIGPWTKDAAAVYLVSEDYVVEEDGAF